MNTILRYLNRFDWIASSATLLVGLVLWHPLVMVAGLIGLVAAWYKPAERIKKHLERKMLRRRQAAQGPTDADLGEDIYAQVEQQVAAAHEHSQGSSPAKTFHDSFAPVSMRIHPSRHNWLKREHFNLAENPSKSAATWG